MWIGRALLQACKVLLQARIRDQLLGKPGKYVTGHDVGSTEPAIHQVVLITQCLFQNVECLRIALLGKRNDRLDRLFVGQDVAMQHHFPGGSFQTGDREIHPLVKGTPGRLIRRWRQFAPGH